MLGTKQPHKQGRTSLAQQHYYRELSQILASYIMFDFFLFEKTSLHIGPPQLEEKSKEHIATREESQGCIEREYRSWVCIQFDLWASQLNWLLPCGIVTLILDEREAELNDRIEQNVKPLFQTLEYHSEEPINASFLRIDCASTSFLVWEQSLKMILHYLRFADYAPFPKQWI